MLDISNSIGDLVSGEELPLSREDRRLLDGECTRCGAPSDRDDSNLCVKCTAAGTRNTRALRQRRRANGRCAFCPARSKKYRCRKCWRKKHRKRRGVIEQNGGVQQAAPLPTKIEKRVEADGYERTRERYIGRGTRGAPTREQLEAEQLRNAKFARREIDKFVEVFTKACAPEVQHLPAIQREAFLHDALSAAGLAGRMIEEVEDFLRQRLKRISREDNKRNRPR